MDFTQNLFSNWKLGQCPNCGREGGSVIKRGRVGEQDRYWGFCNYCFYTSPEREKLEEVQADWKALSPPPT